MNLAFMTYDDFLAQDVLSQEITMSVIRELGETPRVRVAEDYSVTLGPQMIALATAYTGEPEVWQQGLLNDWGALGPDKKWVHKLCALACPRQNGKSKCAVDRAIFGAMSLGERVSWTAHHSGTATKVFAEMKDLIFSNAELRKQVKRIREANGQQEIRFHSGGYINFFTRTKNQARGLTFDLLILDEAQELSLFVWQAISAVVTASPNGQIIVLGTPPNEVAAGDFFNDMRSRLTQTEVHNETWSEWSAEETEDNSHLDNIFEWARANPALGHRLELITFNGFRMVSRLAPAGFAREHLGMFGTTAVSSIVNEDLFTALADPLSQPVTDLAVGLDLNNERTLASISIAGRTSDGRLHIELVRQGQGTAWIVDYLEGLLKRHHFRALIIDEYSAAKSLLDDLKARRIRVKVTGPSDILQACGRFYDSVMNGTLVHLGQDELLVSLMSAKKRAMRNAWVLQPKDHGDITAINAAIFAIYGATTQDRVGTPIQQDDSEEPDSQDVMMPFFG